MRYRTLALGFCLGLGMTTMPSLAEASRSDTRDASRSSGAARQSSTRGGFSAMPAAHRAGASRQSRATGRSRGTSGYSAGISCVPYARQATGMAISGNGRDWWHNAAGRYARSSRPEPGAILSFPSSGGMRSGHVAVVSRVISPRLIEIDHANWGGPGIRRGSVMHGVDVMDVSANNDWTQVRVQVGWSNDQFGREYPTHGFILNRPDDGGGATYASYSPAGGGYSRVSWTRNAMARGSAARSTGIRQAVARPASSTQTAAVSRVDNRAKQSRR